MTIRIVLELPEAKAILLASMLADAAKEARGQSEQSWLPAHASVKASHAQLFEDTAQLVYDALSS